MFSIQGSFPRQYKWWNEWLGRSEKDASQLLIKLNQAKIAEWQGNDSILYRHQSHIRKHLLSLIPIYMSVNVNKEQCHLHKQFFFSKRFPVCVWEPWSRIKLGHRKSSDDCWITSTELVYLPSWILDSKTNLSYTEELKWVENQTLVINLKRT